jgi:hypothetical protein
MVLVVNIQTPGLYLRQCTVEPSTSPICNLQLFTVQSGMLDQAALHRSLMKIRDLGVKLISVHCIGAIELFDDDYEGSSG